MAFYTSLKKIKNTLILMLFGFEAFLLTTMLFTFFTFSGLEGDAAHLNLLGEQRERILTIRHNLLLHLRLDDKKSLNNAHSQIAAFNDIANRLTDDSYAVKTKNLERVRAIKNRTIAAEIKKILKIWKRFKQAGKAADAGHDRMNRLLERVDKQIVNLITAHKTLSDGLSLSDQKEYIMYDPVLKILRGTAIRAKVFLGSYTVDIDEDKMKEDLINIRVGLDRISQMIKGIKEGSDRYDIPSLSADDTESAALLHTLNTEFDKYSDLMEMTVEEKNSLTVSIKDIDALTAEMIKGLNNAAGLFQQFSESKISFKKDIDIILLIIGLLILPAFIILINRIFKERAQAEALIKSQEKQLIQAEKMATMGVLSTGVAHEINNPNTFIMLNADILQSAWRDALPILEEYSEHKGDFTLAGLPFTEMAGEMEHVLSGISDGAKRIKRIVDSLKKYAGKGKNVPNEKVDIHSVIKSAISIINNLIKKSTDNFRLEYGQNLPEIRGNYQQLEQVIINLLDNSCHALQTRDKALALVTSHDKDTNTVIIKICDEGVGIPPDNLPHLTDPFFTTKRDIGGTGLGLSISNTIIRNHGGDMKFTSTPEKGTTVTISLPVEDQNNNS